MKSPFEELEYLVDYLPEEGEAVVVSRRRGELVCETYQEKKPTPPPATPPSVMTTGMATGGQGSQASNALMPNFLTPNLGTNVKIQLPGLSDPELYGRLLQANERLKGCIWNYVWLWAIGVYWLCMGAHWLGSDLSWSALLPIDFGIVLIASIGALTWVQYQQWKMFHMEICPLLERQLVERETNKHHLISQMRQHPELKLLTTILSRWTT